ncbi:MAG TPA: hypothetical protein VMW65_06390 [Chloroflexota bacterium]|nr:hypothetical protein [Chloroflexota bacterium]
MTVKKVCTTYRYVVRVGPKFVHGGITEDLEVSKVEAKVAWPAGQFFQVGEKTSLDEARDWVTRNGFSVERSA